MQKQKQNINLQMDPLGNLLTIRPIQTGWEISIALCPNWHFGCIDNLDRRFINSLVPTQTRTQSDGWNPLEQFWVRAGTGTEPLQWALP